jgi:WD40 repeat protein
VKSLTIIPGYLLSTSSDRSIKLWRLGERPLSEGLDCAQTLKLHSRPVDCSAVSQTENDDGEVQTRVWTADSMGVIHEWSITASGLTHWKTLKGHETSITQLLPTDDGLWSGKFRTAGLADIFLSVDGQNSHIPFCVLRRCQESDSSRIIHTFDIARSFMVVLARLIVNRR